MALDIDSTSSSQILNSSSYGSFTPSKRSSSEVSKVYKHASQLFLTRRLSEAYDVLQPVITPSKVSNGYNYEDGDALLAPVATASTSQRIKIWSLYTTLLSNIIDLGPADGKRDFGAKYREITKSVQDGDVWEQIVRDGYRGREGSVDAEVVYNLSNLLLGQAPNQRMNQSRLETYLSSSSLNSSLDISQRLDSSMSGTRRSQLNGTSTPKDLTSRIRILELFTLHVLPRNEEWEFARSFIQNSDILDEERREAFLQTLTELKEVKETEEGFDEAEDEVFKDARESASAWRPRLESMDSVVTDDEPSSHPQNGGLDYGLDEKVRQDGHSTNHQIPSSRSRSQIKPHTPPSISSFDDQPLQTLDPHPEPPNSPPYFPSSSHTNKQIKPPPPNPGPTHPSSKPQIPPQSSSSSSRRTTKPPPTKKPTASLIQKFHTVYKSLTSLTHSITSSFSTAVLLRMLFFIVAFLILFSRRSVRERVRRIVGRFGGKVRQTVGMGTKVSYI